jgi:hypothetical protein
MGSRELFLFRFEQASEKLFEREADSGVIVEQPRRTWRKLSEGDQLVFTNGGGDDTRFVAYATVVALDRQPVSPPERQIVPGPPLERLSIWFEQYVSLPVAVLADYMYSLTVISNFTRPWLNLRHRRQLPKVDLDTLINNHLALARSLYFAALRYMPEDWRNYVEAQVEERLSVESLSPRGRVRQWTYSSRVRHLRHVLDAAVIRPLEHARATAIGRNQSFREELSPIIARGPAGDWPVEPLLNRAPDLWGDIEEEWGEFSALSENQPEEQEGREWRTHRW